MTISNPTGSLNDNLAIPPQVGHGSIRDAFRWGRVALLAGIVVLGALLRFAQLGSESYWIDEVIMVGITQGDFNEIADYLQGSSRPPLFVWLGYGWSSLWGSSEAATRSLSAVAGIFSIVMLWIVARRLFSAPVALISSLIMALSAFQVWHSQDYRYYAVLQLMILLALYFYLRFLDGARPLDMILYVVFSALSAYTHTFAIFFFVALGLHFLLRWHRSRGMRVVWVVSQLLILAAITPVLQSNFGTLGDVVAADSEETSELGGGTAVVDWLPLPPPYAPARTLANFLLIQRSYASVTLMLLAGGLVAASIVYAMGREGLEHGQ